MTLDSFSREAAANPFVPLRFTRHSAPEMVERARALLTEMNARRTTRHFSTEPVPRELIERPKMGFGVPVDQWLRGPLKSWAENLLDESKLRRQGYLNVPLVNKTWNEHQSGSRNWQHQLWSILMFQAWLESLDVQLN